MCDPIVWGDKRNRNQKSYKIENSAANLKFSVSNTLLVGSHFRLPKNNWCSCFAI